MFDLLRANNDMNNLLAGTGIAIVDHQLRIQRFPPAATKIINLIQSDIGRPVSHIVSNLPGHGNLKEDTQAVVDTLVPKEADRPKCHRATMPGADRCRRNRVIGI